jgi:hypothetical protein
MHNTSFMPTFCPHFDLAFPKVTKLIVPRKIENPNLCFLSVISEPYDGNYLG